ncbi:hypothetical protein OYC64_009155 [Pagothenia borchgrevinki]|uniref:Uncharacterized protein n=1 Tax=Pagothenia borchgrevinki TaxID=8213 RepID=A0ABD2H369_PAGBO
MKQMFAFVTTRLDYCNGVLFGVPKKNLDRLQYVQNCAARSLHALAPQYLSDILRPHAPPRNLRSSDSGLLTTPRTKLRTFGDRAYSVAAPTLWNALLAEIRYIPTLDAFKRALKTHLFAKAFGP